MGFDRNAASDQAFGHKPVLLEECLTALDIKPDGIYVDGTLGRAGHSLEIVKKLTGKGRLICLDRDETAIEAAKIRLADYLDRVTLVHSNFSRIAEVLHQLDIPGVDGMLFDLGVSSPQLDEARRGFSYMHDAPLDMRMDRTAALTARDVVNDWSYEDLRRILFEYGEERYAPAIAKAIVRRRQEAAIETTGQLVDIPPLCGKSSTRPSAAFRPSASPSTMNWASCPPCSKPPPTLSAPADAWPSSASIPWKTVLLRKPCRSSPLAAPAHLIFLCACAAKSPGCGW